MKETIQRLEAELNRWKNGNACTDYFGSDILQQENSENGCLCLKEQENVDIFNKTSGSSFIKQLWAASSSVMKSNISILYIRE